MLVLSRKAGESIKIGPDIEITLVQVRGGRARIGIDAPRKVNVKRTELAEGKDDVAEETQEAEGLARPAVAGRDGSECDPAVPAMPSADQKRAG